MFNTKLKDRLIEQELQIVRLQEDLKFACLRAKDAEDKLKVLQQALIQYEGVDEEELELERKLRKEELKTAIARSQIDKQKEAEEAYDIKPKMFR